MAFVHLHVHSEYSMLDGACRIRELPSAAKKMGQKALALTDHGAMFGAVSFYKECKKAGIDPIIGCEVYVAPVSRFSKDPTEKYHHLILLCENEEGYNNLSKLVSAGYTEGMYAKPRVDDELLQKYHTGLIALSGCLAGRIPQLLLKNDYEGAKQAALDYEKLFGQGNFYLEIQNHLLNDEQIVRKGLLRLSMETGVPLAATNDAHYIDRRGADVQNVLICIQTGRTLEEGSPLAFENDEFYLKSEEEMAPLFSDCPQALENTAKIAARCRFDFDFSSRHLPSFPLAEGENANDCLKAFAQKGLEEKKANGSLDLAGHSFDDYKMRMIYELMMIAKMGYSDYFLIVWDFVRAAKDRGITVGPGRGSGAGSLVAFLIGITEVDPIVYDLLFERFLNPERVSMPDFDVDFCDARRDEVIAYVSEKYGRDHVSQIAAFGTLGAKAAVHDAARVMGVPPKEADAISALIPRTLDMTIDKALEGKELKALYEQRDSYRRLIDVARSIEGMPRNITTHAAGVVITEKPVCDYMPLTVSSGALLTQYDMNTVAELGLLKFDFLALRYLTVIENAEREVKRSLSEYDPKKIPLDDAETYDMICAGETDGVFQLESAGMKRLMTKLKPRSPEDLMIAIAVYRPGPMESIPTLLSARGTGEKPTYKIPLLAEILDNTSGCIVYQEQVMQIFRKVAGYSYGRADVVRRAMAKKHASELEAEREGFLSGAERNNVDRESAKELFDSMASFASYAFNKSHAAAYALVAYRTAYLKCNFPREYISALLTSVSGDPLKTARYVTCLEKKKLKLLPPCVNESSAFFTPVPGGVRFGLYGIKNLGNGFVDAIMKERAENGAFVSLEDFLMRMKSKGAGKTQTAALIGAGAFDCFGVYRSRMNESLEELLSFVNEKLRRMNDSQIDLFTAAGKTDEDLVGFVYPEMAEYPLDFRLNTEKELTGMWFSGHPLEDYSSNMNDLRPVKIAALLPDEEEQAEDADLQNATVCGMISSVSVKTSKAGRRFAIMRLEDDTASIECLVFEKALEASGEFIKKDAAVCIKGRLTDRDKEQPKLTVLDLLPLIPNEKYVQDPPSRAAEQTKKPAGDPTATRKLYIKLTLDPAIDDRLRAIVDIFEGSIPCFFYDPSTKAYSRCRTGVGVTPYLLSVLESIAGKDKIVYK